MRLSDKEISEVIEKEVGDGDESGVLVKPSTLLRLCKKVSAMNCSLCEDE